MHKRRGEEKGRGEGVREKEWEEKKMWMVITDDPSMVNTEGFTSEVEVTMDLWGDGALEASHELAWAEESKCTVQERFSVPINKLFEVNLTSLSAHTSPSPYLSPLSSPYATLVYLDHFQVVVLQRLQWYVVQGCEVFETPLGEVLTKAD